MKATSLLVMMLLLFSASYGQNQASGGELAPIPGRFVVKFKASARPSAVQQALSEGRSLEPVGVGRLRSDLVAADTWQRYFVFTAKGASPTTDEVSAILGPQNIEYIEPVYPLELFDWPTDDLVSAQWYLHNEGQAYPAVIRRSGYYDDTLGLEQGTAGNDVNIAYYYEHAPDTVKKIVVAIVDTGVDPIHPELQGRLWHNPDEIEGNGIDDDHNGFVDDIIGYDISGDSAVIYGEIPDNDPTDHHGHGTHCSGIVASAFDGSGIVGVSPSVEIMGVKVHPNLTSVNGARGIVYAVNAGADIVSCSWGGPFNSKILEDAIDYATSNGVLVCVAAGNSGDNSRSYPANYANAFTVAASNSNGYMAYFTTWGPFVDIVAPGQSILSLRAAGTDMYTESREPYVHIVDSEGLYYLASGTSMSTPLVAGGAAFVWSIRPNLTLEQLKTDLALGARDMVDPRGIGEWLPGVDSVSGAGLLDIRSTLELVDNGGLYFVAPTSRDRHLDAVEVRAAAVGPYDGGWTLDYRVGSSDPTWHRASQGASLPYDGLLHTFTSELPSGEITLRLTDQHAVARYRSFTFVSDTRCELSSPADGSTQTYNINVTGSLYGPELDSAVIWYRQDASDRTRVEVMTGEYFESLIYSWNASALDLGDYSMILEGYCGSQILTDSVHFVLVSAFADGWPQTLGCTGVPTPVSSDMDHDGIPEIIIGGECGLAVYEPDGSMRAGFPIMLDERWGTIPALYDIDRDGRDEIVWTASDGLHVTNDDGTEAAGWPVHHNLIASAVTSFPIPSVTLLDAAEDSVITLVNGDGQILAFNFDGTPYRYSTDGLFAPTPNGGSAPQSYCFHGAIGVDLDGDGQNECLSWLTAIFSDADLSAFDAVTGGPAWGRSSPTLLACKHIANVLVGDLTGDSVVEIVTVGTDSDSETAIWVMDGRGNPLPGWPRVIPEAYMYLRSFPAIADLDLDGQPEILASFSEYDLGLLYAFRLDGSPYLEINGFPEGQVARAAVTFGGPLVADITGDEYPEILIRTGYILQGTGREYIYALDHTMAPLPGWPLATPADPNWVTTMFDGLLVQDVDGDDLVELTLVDRDKLICIWNLDAPSQEGTNTARLFVDNCNSAMWRPTARGPASCCEGLVGDVNMFGGDEPTPNDISLLVDHLYINLVDLPCLTEADANLSGQGHPTYDDITIGDINALIDHLYISQEPLMLCP